MTFKEGLSLSRAIYLIWSRIISVNPCCQEVVTPKARRLTFQSFCSVRKSQGSCTCASSVQQSSFLELKMTAMIICSNGWKRVCWQNGPIVSQQATTNDGMLKRVN